MIHYAAADAYDAAVLLSGDQDFVPAVEAANALGKRVYVAVWPQSGVSKVCYGQINLEEGVSFFSSKHPRRAQPHVQDSLDPDSRTNMLSEIKRALTLHEYLSRGHFINRWRSQLHMPEPGSAREMMLDALISDGKVVEGTRESNGQVIKTLELPSD